MKNRWSVVIHEVSQATVNIWVGTLFSDMRMPALARIVVTSEDQAITRVVEIQKGDWLRPFRDLTQRFYHLASLSGLPSDLAFDVSFEERLRDGWIKCASGNFTTLPDRLSERRQFTVALGSCFYEEYDGGAASYAYESLCLSDVSPVQPDVKFLTGDQVYLDIGLDSLSTVKREIHERIAGDYALNWQAMRGILRQGGSWLLADDHEYWNNYPCVNVNPFLLALNVESVRRNWVRSADDGVRNIQRITPVRTFSLGGELNFCVADMRSKRTDKRMLPDDEFRKILNWLKALRGPGVLVLPQPILVKRSGDGDRNLPWYTKQYGQLIRAIASADHDVLILSGDVHYGRMCSVQFAGSQRRLYEVVSSPLSNLSGFSSVAANSVNKDNRLVTFPDVEVEGISPVRVRYPSGKWSVSTESSALDFRYLKKRTKEHFMTLSFSAADNGVRVAVQAWRVRETDRRTGLPKSDFPSPLVFEMQ